MHRAIFLLFSLVPILARAEVLDKEFSLPTVASFAVVGAVAAFLAARYRPWLLLVTLPPVVFFFGLHLSEFFVPIVGQATVAEGGATYVLVSWGGALAVLVCCALGFAGRGRRGRVDA